MVADRNSGAGGRLVVSAGSDARLVETGGGSTRFVRVRLVAPEADGAGERLPLNLGLIVDASGSMTGSRLAAAKESARLVAQALGEDSRLSVVSFDSWPRVHVDGVEVGRAGRAQALAAIASMRTGGCTNLSGGYFAGCEAVARVMESGLAASNRVVLFSDGRANQGIVDPVELGAHADALCRRGLLSTTVGIGTDYSSRQLEAIATHGGGQMHHAATPGQIAEVVLGEIGEAGRTAVERSTVIVSAPPGVEVEPVGDWAQRAGRDGLRVETGAIVGGRAREVILRLTFPAGERGSEAAVRVRCRWRGPGWSSSVEEDGGWVRFRYASAVECASQGVDADVALAAATALHAWVAGRATAMNEDRRYREAEDLVQRELRWFRDYVVGLPGGGELIGHLERLCTRVAAEMDPMLRKEMMMASRKRARGEREHRHGQMKDWYGHL